ncbi:MAG: HAD family hydrolase [Candidatus Hydrogenedentes bacterium]|nr:HAD family hydrolase [Candidatus Hydrogenedentota bacterium]
MLKAVIFDLDGTLVDSTEAIVKCFMATCDEIGEPRPEEADVVRTIGFTLEQQFEMLTSRDTEMCAKVYRRHYEETACATATLLPGGRACLQSLENHGLKLGFATSKKRCYAEMILEHLGVLDFFSSRIGPDEVAQPKPHPEAVLKSLTTLAVGADEAIFVGDTYFDVLAARDAQVDCVCVTTGYNSREELEALAPAAVLDSLGEVADYIFARDDAPEELRHLV